MPGWVGLTFRRRREIGCRPASPPRRAGRATFCSPTPSRNTCPVVTWHGIAGRLKASAVSIRNITRPATTSIFAGACSRTDTTSRLVRLRSCGIIGVSRSRVSQTTEGYGEAESMLRFKHLIFFGPTGTAKWRGQIYGTPRFSWFINPADHLPRHFRRRIFPIDLSHAAIGSRCVLEQHRMVRADGFSFRARIFFAGAAHRSLPDVWRHTCASPFPTCCARGSNRASTPSRRVYSSCSSLSRSHSFGDGRAISHGCISNARRAESSARMKNCRRHEAARGKFAAARLLERGGEGPASIAHFRSSVLEEEGWRYSTDTGWNEWDIQIYGNFWWSIALQTVTEYHGGMKALTRAALRYRFVTTTVIINLVMLSILIYRQLNRSHIDLWSVIPYVLFVIFLAHRARRLKLRVAELVDVAAHRIGLQRIFRRGAKAKPAADAAINVPANVNCRSVAVSDRPLFSANGQMSRPPLQRKVGGNGRFER